MHIALVSRLLMLPDYLSSLHVIDPLPNNWSSILHTLNKRTSALALLVGAISIILASIFGGVGILRKQNTQDSSNFDELS